MAQLKANSTMGGIDIANINLEGVERSNFTTAHLASIKGNTGANGSNGSNATVSKSGNNLNSTGNSAINLASVTTVNYNGSNLGYHKIYLNGTRVYEKYQVDNTYQTWVEEGHWNHVTTTEGPFWDELAPWFWWNVSSQTNYLYWGSGHPKAVFGGMWSSTHSRTVGEWTYEKSGGIRYNYMHPGPEYRHWAIKRSKTESTWVDTSHYITEGSIDDTYYY